MFNAGELLSWMIPCWNGLEVEGDDQMLKRLRGWSTTLLNSQGAIFILGGFPRRYASSMKIRNKLEFPPPIPSPTAVQLEPAIKQFSQGRVFSLGLDDHGVVWWWETYNLTYRVAVTNIDLNQHTVTRVVAGT